MRVFYPEPSELIIFMTELLLHGWQIVSHSEFPCADGKCRVTAFKVPHRTLESRSAGCYSAEQSRLFDSLAGISPHQDFDLI